MKTWKLIAKSAAVLTVVFSGFAIFYYRNNDRSLGVTSYTYESDKYRESKDFKIVQLSDFHNHALQYSNQNLIDAIKQQQPDVIVCTGDMIDSHTKDFSMLEALAESWEKAGVPFYYVDGNHEMYAPKKIAAKAHAIFDQHLGKNLGGSRVDLGNGIVLSGLRDPGSNHKDGPYLVKNVGDIPEQLAQLKKSLDPHKLNVMLCHRPDLFDLLSLAGYDITLSGHTHGGQIQMGKWAVAVYPWTSYIAGRYVQNNSTLLVSRGLGSSHFLPIRYHCEFEIVVLTIKSKVS